MNKITIVIRDGAVVAAEGIPTDLTVEVRNYDVAKIDKQQLSHDAEGKEVNVQELHAAE